MVSWLHPKPAPPGFGGQELVPEGRAWLLNKLIMHWLSPILNVGFSRPLEKEDLWQLPDAKLTRSLASAVEANYYARLPPEQRPRAARASEMADKEITSQASHHEEKIPAEEHDSGAEALPTATSNTQKSKYDRSLTKALHTTFWVRWWLTGLATLVADTLKTTSPLVSQALLTWLTEVYVYRRLPEDMRAQFPKPQGVGYGMGLVVGLFVMQETASLISQHYIFTAMSTGMMLRGTVIGMIFRKSLRLSGRARNEHSVGQITTMISTDATRLELSTTYFHNSWVGLIQFIIGVALLIRTLGYSALVGLGVLLLAFPVQGILVTVIFKQSSKGVAITDQRVRLTNEVMQGIRLIKFFSWENFYLGQINALRVKEMATVRKFSLALAAMIGSVTFMPVLASILSFITYYLTGHDLNIAIIFTSLQFFTIIRQPLTVLPFVMSAVAQAMVSLNRISKFLSAEEMATSHEVDKTAADSVMMDADFTWEVTAKSATEAVEDQKKHKPEDKSKKGKGKGKKPTSDLPTTNQDMQNNELSDDEKRKPEKPFELRDLKLHIPKGAFVAVVGRVGSGKSSLLQSIIGEMRRTRGKVVIGGSFAYVPQSAWIMNASIRDNILFGAKYNEAKFRATIETCSLQHDLDMLPHHEETEIGERGINLSGGQKARVSVARAAYADADIVILDDCLSAVDAHVAKALTDNLLLSGPMAQKTRILATHSLTVLPKVDYIYVMEQGAIVEEGVYSDLINRGGMFANLVHEYGSRDDERAHLTTSVQAPGEARGKGGIKEEDQNVKEQSALMQDEERVTGAVDSQTYIKYSRYAGSVLWAPTIIILLVLSQAATVATNLFLSFWTDQSLGLSQPSYMGIYIGLGGATAITSTAVSYAFSLMGIAAGVNISSAALNGVLLSPVSWFDTTPIGRVISRLSKDQEVIDKELSTTMWGLASTVLTILGTIALVFYVFPYLGIIFVPLAVIYYFVALFYRRTSVEVKRLDSLMRSSLYASYNETLTGVTTVRAYAGQDRFIRTADDRLDMENRAYYMTIAIQAWLGLRLDALGTLLILGIGLFAAGQASWDNATSPSKIGVVLTYALAITEVFSQMVSSYAQNEQNMNAVERVLTYTELRSEGRQAELVDPPPSWPSAGAVKFEDVHLTYRPELPPILHGVSFDIRPKEKVGIVGRTGAGKSSLIQALFRIVELQSGRILIDGVDIAGLHLNALRTKLAFVPQDSLLFLGSLRDNVDPTRSRTDAEVVSALQRTWLLPQAGMHDSAAEAKFGLNASVGDDGSNYSAGERQLLALCRALIKNSQIIILDEATSNVDVETDAKIQKTIQTEFSDSTLLCIAHRLNTIAYYDRILVLDAGQVAEFDTPLALFDRHDGIFRSLCNEAGLSREDIERIRASVGK